MIMQVLWLSLIYFVTGLAGTPSKRKPVSRQRDMKLIRFKSVFTPFLIGLTGVWIADWLSDGNPLWPALGLVSGVVGVMYPFWRQADQEVISGLAVYFGGVFYLQPVIALAGFGFVLEVLLLSKDWILAVIIFSSILPVLFSFSQVNPMFFWVGIMIQLLFWIKLKKEIRVKIKGSFNPD